MRYDQKNMNVYKNLDMDQILYVTNLNISLTNAKKSHMAPLLCENKDRRPFFITHRMVAPLGTPDTESKGRSYLAPRM